MWFPRPDPPVGSSVCEHPADFLLVGDDRCRGSYAALFVDFSGNVGRAPMCSCYRIGIWCVRGGLNANAY